MFCEPLDIQLPTSGRCHKANKGRRLSLQLNPSALCSDLKFAPISPPSHKFNMSILPVENRTRVDNTLTVSSDFKCSPLPLTHVCRRWRLVATAHRKLWSSIAVSVKPRTPARSKDILKLLRVWTSRAQGTLLSLYVGSEGGHDAWSNEEAAFAAGAFHTFLPHASKWRHIMFGMKNPSLETFFADIISKAKFTQLKTFWLELSEEPSNSTVSVYKTLFAASPKLARLVVDDALLEMIGEEEGFVDSIPWSSLKQLDFTCECIHSKTLLGLLCRTTSLESLETWRIEGDALSNGDKCGAPLTLPYLRELRVTLSTHPKEFLSNLNLPSLKNVSISVHTLAPPSFRAEGPHADQLKNILAPLDRMLETSTAVSTLQCSVRLGCLSDLEQLPTVAHQKESWRGLLSLPSAWFSDSGLKRLAGLSNFEFELSRY
ncbi:hypothetical protein BKA70DRAFT_1310065 [Coprinopsis sp. MPI-PUGE-AT-0042]|nr:hypothetical protein BKA70DRAFT_1310065 [Coprinopsis sp. MPI-PUGE-AT-0042]